MRRSRRFRWRGHRAPSGPDRGPPDHRRFPGRRRPGRRGRSDVV